MDLQSLNKFVINLSERTDRLELVKKELEGWNYSVNPGIKNDNPMLGIAQAHIDCVFKAQFLNWPYVLIMEDDVKLRPGIEEYLNEAFKNLPEDWDILLGGVYLNTGRQAFNEYWDKCGEFCGLHFYIVNSKCYDHFLAYDKTKHLDRWLNYGGKKINCYVTKKFVATQREGFSDNVKKYEDYSHLIKKHQLL